MEPGLQACHEERKQTPRSLEAVLLCFYCLYSSWPLADALCDVTTRAEEAQAALIREWRRPL